MKKVLTALLLALMFAFLPAALPQQQNITQVQAAQKKGWHKKGKNYYYVNADGKKAERGWLTLGSKKYYIKKNKYRAANTFLTIDGHKYYFDKKGCMKKGWITYKSKKYYAGSNGWIVTGRKTIGKKSYYFNSKGVMQKNKTIAVSKMHEVAQKSTLLGLLKKASEPLGQTVYIWGGGWDSGTNTGDGDGNKIGLGKKWVSFFKKQNSSYNYNNTRFQVHNGLDCSGYVGWALYNVFQKTSDNPTYVMLAQSMAKTHSSWGWGSYKAAGTFSDFRPGDIMSYAGGHVYIVVGQCSDGSVVLMHSSPPGVQLSGTYTRSGSKNSQAVQLATKYMKKYRPAWYAKFPKNERGTSYLTSYSRMRWGLGGKYPMSDPEGLHKMNAEQVLKLVFGE